MKRNLTHSELLVATVTFAANIFYFIRSSALLASGGDRLLMSSSDATAAADGGSGYSFLFEVNRSQPFFTFPTRLSVFFKARFVQIMFFAKRARIDFRRNLVALMILETFCISECFHAARTPVIR